MKRMNHLALAFAAATAALFLFINCERMSVPKYKFTNEEPQRTLSPQKSTGLTRADLNCGFNDVSPYDVVDIDVDGLMDNRMGAARQVWTEALKGKISIFKICTSEDTDLSSTSIRAAFAPGVPRDVPLWIIADQDRVLPLVCPLQIIKRNNVVIDGRGANITLKRHGVLVGKSENIVIHNIGVKDLVDPYMNCDGRLNTDPEGQDGIKTFKSNQVWIDHNIIQNIPDEAIQITTAHLTAGENRTTISHNKILNRKGDGRGRDVYEGHGVMVGCERRPDDLENHPGCPDTKVTVIRNHYEVDNRTPFVYGLARVQSLNNRIDQPEDWFAGAKMEGMLYSSLNWYNASQSTGKKSFFHLPHYDTSGCAYETKDVGRHGAYNNENCERIASIPDSKVTPWGNCTECMTRVRLTAGRSTTGQPIWKTGKGCTQECRWSDQ